MDEFDEMPPDEIYKKIDIYLSCVETLVQGLERDVKNGKTISDDTILRLSKLIAAQSSIENLRAMFEISQDDGGYSN